MHSPKAYPVTSRRRDCIINRTLPGHSIHQRPFKYALIVLVAARIIASGGDMTKLPDATDVDVVVEIPPQFQKYADAAMLRLQVLYPACRLASLGGGISVISSGGFAQDQFRKDVLHVVYREKIYAETLTMRQALVAAVTSR